MCVLRVGSELFKLDYVEFEADVWTSKGGKYCNHVNISLQQPNVNIVPVSSGTLVFFFVFFFKCKCEPVIFMLTSSLCKPPPT